MPSCIAKVRWRASRQWHPRALLTAPITTEMEKPCRCISVPGCSIEGLEASHEIHVQPFQSGFARSLCCLSQQTAPDPLALNVGVHCCVQNEPVNAAIPRDVYEAHQPCALKGCDVDKTMLKYRLEISLLVGWPRRLEETVEFFITKGRLKAVADFVHFPSILLSVLHRVNRSSCRGPFLYSAPELPKVSM
jgi:hypothetical protein